MGNLNNLKDYKIEMPEWIYSNENYIPLTDKDTFVNKSILSVFHVISRIRMQDSVGNSRFKINVSLNVFFTFLLIVLLSITRSFIFVVIVIVYLLSILSFTEADKLVKILKFSFSVTLFTAIIMLPAFLMGNSYSSIMITTKVFATTTSMGLLSYSSKWNSITETLKLFHVPDIFILILDITIKYIFMLGDYSINMLYALKLRSVGKNNNKYTSMAGIAGTTFLQSKEMVTDMYHAMECRGFTGEYHICKKSKFKWVDYIFMAINVGAILLFFHFERT